MRKKILSVKLAMLLISLFMTFGLVGCGNKNDAQNSDVMESKTIIFEGEYNLLSYEQMMKEADVIFSGEIKAITSTLWNQDNHEYWEDVTHEKDAVTGETLTTSHTAWPIHEIELSVTRAIVDDIGIDKEVTLTVLGKSPTDDSTLSAEDSVQVAGEAEHSLQVGDEIIIFVQQAELAWKDSENTISFVSTNDGGGYFDIGTRTIFNFIGVPDGSYLLKGENDSYSFVSGYNENLSSLSLEELIGQIASTREIISTQP